MEIKPADREIIDRKDLRYKRKVSNKGIKDMNKQAYEATVKMLLSKRANDGVQAPIRLADASPTTATSSLISSTPSSLVADVVSSPVNIAMAGSASSGKGSGARRWVLNKHLMGKGPAALSMLFPNTAGLYYGYLGDLTRIPQVVPDAFNEMKDKGLLPDSDDTPPGPWITNTNLN